MPLHPRLQSDLDRVEQCKVILLGSGGLSIGQAGEFDYSGNQAIRALVSEGLHVIVINPNIATVQTNPDQENVTVYLYPVQAEWVEKVIIKENPTAIIAGFGGQTALNCLLDLEDKGILEKYSVTVLGTQTDTLRTSEDRKEFCQLMQKMGMPVPQSVAATTTQEALDAGDVIGYPVILRAAYALGGLGSGFAENRDQLQLLASQALSKSPQVLIEKSIKGWKELEYEVMRDQDGNTIVICNMENIDPLGIHTGDSIVTCPSQSLSDLDYQRLRNAAIEIIQELKVVGECNVQFALDPYSDNFYVIEVNARLSRSSALASKATGYPIAFIAAKVVCGQSLLELKNPMTKCTSAFFEPALDYITIKIPKWDLSKFPGVKRLLGSTMKSVGEVMAIGRSFEEALQKGIRMVTEDEIGISHFRSFEEDLADHLGNPTDNRIYAIFEALRQNKDIDWIHEHSKVDKWFLFHLKEIVAGEKEIQSFFENCRVEGLDFQNSVERISEDTWLSWKQLGFSDKQIAYLYFNPTQETPSAETLFLNSTSVREARLAKNVIPCVKRIDTTAAEYPSPSNYFFVTYHGQSNDLSVAKDSPKALILGSGPYRIGTSVEFDWCAVSCSETLQANGWLSVMINCNPETVSTDFNVSTSLYFEEMGIERIQDIAAFEHSKNIVCNVGGQLPNSLAIRLNRMGFNLMGHSSKTIDLAEDRYKFSALLDSLKIDQPKWICASDEETMKQFIDDVGFPVLVRPSYVLSGAAMRVVYNEENLQECLQKAFFVSPDHPVVVTAFIQDAKEIEIDGVASDGEILTAVVSEHVENAGVHSGDAMMVVPAQTLYTETVRQIRRIAKKLAHALHLHGPFNIQFIAKENEIKVIETNVRAARSFPFVSKVTGIDLAKLATEVMLYKNSPSLMRRNEDDLNYVGVKAPMFSFSRLSGSDPILGVEMMSTGEVGCIGTSFHEALLLALEATHTSAPKKAVLVSSGGLKTKLKFLKIIEPLQMMNLKIYATEGTARYLNENGIEATAVAWGDEKDKPLTADDLLINRVVDLVINIPKNYERAELTRGARIRRLATEINIPLITNMEKAVAFIQALAKYPNGFKTVHSLPPYEKPRKSNGGEITDQQQHREPPRV